jgi:hypothetical protein
LWEFGIDPRHFYNVIAHTMRKGHEGDALACRYDKCRTRLCSDEQDGDLMIISLSFSSFNKCTINL